jgi:hypothetical protein
VGGSSPSGVSPETRGRGSGYARLVGIGSGLARLEGYPFDVRYSDGALPRATAAADVAAAAYTYFDRLFAGVEPDIALIVADQTDWLSRQPYGLAFFNDDPGQIPPGVVVIPAASGDFWSVMVHDLRETASHDYPKLLETYPDGVGGVDLQPFFDLISRSMSWATHLKRSGISGSPRPG